ncbi:MAG: hypothetical protein CR217_11970 [Beijerinckiaceae bacterium]|nr:MAG: hypothetical protein CR217_11970 [Beijerinckiaceae bacterium]
MGQPSELIDGVKGKTIGGLIDFLCDKVKEAAAASLLFLPASVTDYCSGKPTHFCSDVDTAGCRTLPGESLAHLFPGRRGVRQSALEPGTRNELTPRVLTISANAEAPWRGFYDHVEGQCGAK